MFLTPDILAILISDFIFLFLAIVSLYISTKIYLKWNINSSSKTQYELEKQTVLPATIIKYIFIIKIPLFIFFIFTVDKISNVITGAMCSAGVIDATVYGPSLLILKLINIYLFGFWLVLNHYDNKREDLKFTKIKFGLFIPLFLLLSAEIILDLLMFSSLDINKIVSCCGTLFSSSSETTLSFLFLIPNSIIVTVFYVNFFLIVLFYLTKSRTLFALFNIIFPIIAIYSLIMFFGTYIYQLPTHHCPFCMLQKDYDYIGYILYITLFTGSFSGILTKFIGSKKIMNISMAFNVIYTLIITLYVVIYYLKNGVFL